MEEDDGQYGQRPQSIYLSSVTHLFSPWLIRTGRNISSRLSGLTYTLQRAPQTSELIER